MKPQYRSTIAAVALVVAGVTAFARVDVRVERDKTFDFSTVRTWSWPSDGHGDVMMARTQQDNPARIKEMVEPWIVETVELEMSRAKLTRAETGADLTLKYYLLLSTSLSAQTMGQFLPPVAEWGLPPFAPATQSLKFMNRGSLVIDLTANGTVVWRGLAQTNVKPDVDNSKREALVREAVRDLLRRYPKKT